MNNIEYSGIDTYGELHHAMVKDIFFRLLELHKIKSATYKDSWSKRGNLGIFFTMIRPIDRVQNIILESNTNDRVQNVLTRTFFDALCDMALYAVKWAAIIIQTDKTLYNSWKLENGLKSDMPELFENDHMSDIKSVSNRTVIDGLTMLEKSSGE